MIGSETIRHACSGDEEAFSEILVRCRPSILRVVRRAVRRADDLDDLLQEIFLRIFVSLARLQSPQFLDAWVRRVTLNATYDYLRKQRRIPEVLMTDLLESQLRAVETLGCSPRQSGECHQIESRVEADALLASIPLPDRELLLLREVDGYSVKDLAQALSVSENAVAVRLLRARRKARRVEEPTHLAHVLTQ